MTADFQPLRGRPVVAAILAGMVAMSVANLLPLMVGVLADRMALTSREAGLVAAADIAGLAVGSVVCTLFRRFSLRVIGIAGLALLAAANLGTIATNGFAALALIRFVGGFGGGLALAICYAVLGAGDQARDFAIFNIGQIAIGWLGLLFITPLLATFGWQGLFLILAALAALAAVIALWLPSHVPHPGDMSTGPAQGGGGGGTVALLGRITVLSVLVYFTGQGGVWAYLDRIGTTAHLSAELVTRGLAWCMFCGMVASALATWLDTRLGLLLPLLAGYIATTIGLIQLGSVGDGQGYLIATSVFVFGWNVIVPYQFAVVAKVDPDGRYAMLAATASVAGLALGPALVSSLADQGAYGSIRAVALVLNVVSLALLWPGFKARLPSQP